MQGHTTEDTQVIIVPLGMDEFHFQTDDGFVLLDVDWKGHAYTFNRMIDYAVDEEGDIGHEFAHPRRIRYLIYGPLQDVGFSVAFEKHIKVLIVCDENKARPGIAHSNYKRNYSTCIGPCSCS